METAVGSRKHTRKKEGAGGENGQRPRCLRERRVAGLRLEKERGGLALPNNNDGNDGDNHKGKMPPALVPGKCPQGAG